jgi:hypothetical protein
MSLECCAEHHSFPAGQQLHKHGGFVRARASPIRSRELRTGTGTSSGRFRACKPGRQPCPAPIVLNHSPCDKGAVKIDRQMILMVATNRAAEPAAFMVFFCVLLCSLILWGAAGRTSLFAVLLISFTCRKVFHFTPCLALAPAPVRRR